MKKTAVDVVRVALPVLRNVLQWKNAHWGIYFLL